MLKAVLFFLLLTILPAIAGLITDSGDSFSVMQGQYRSQLTQ